MIHWSFDQLRLGLNSEDLTEISVSVSSIRASQLGQANQAIPSRICSSDYSPNQVLLSIWVPKSLLVLCGISRQEKGKDRRFNAGEVQEPAQISENEGVQGKRR